MKTILFLLLVLLQGNPTYLLQTKNLTVYTDIRNDDKVYLTVVENFKDSGFTTRTACYEINNLLPGEDGRTLFFRGGGLCYIPNNVNHNGFMFEDSNYGKIYTTFNSAGIIYKDTTKYAKSRTDYQAKFQKK